MLSEHDQRGRLTRWLTGASPAAFSAFAIAAAFAAYFAMYAFRKPFTAAAFAGQTVGSLALKDALVISQVIGYALSKWLGVKLLSELPPERRALALLALVGLAEASLVAFALVPPEARVAAIFVNGLPLGAIWGLVFGFLEGRRTSEILGAGLSCAYIVASGVVKSAGGWVMTDLGVSEAWMPAVTGLLFAPVFGMAVWALRQLPPPDPRDEAARTARVPMYGAQRRAFFLRFALGLVALTVIYVFLTACRDFRDNYARDIWDELGYPGRPALLALTELPVAFGVMVALALLYLVKDNRLGLLVTHGLMLVGALVIGLSTLLFDAGLLGPLAWMIGVGLGLYLAYVPYGCVLFDRMIAATGVMATAVFMIYVTDAAGYAGSVGLVLYKHFGHSEMSRLDFLRHVTYATAAASALGFAISALYFARRSRPGSAG